MHRWAVWIGAAAAVIAAGGAALAWGDSQRHRAQSLAAMVDAGYAGALRAEVADLDALRAAVASASMMADPESFRRHLADIEKYAYAAQQDMARIPDGGPDHRINQELHQIGFEAEHWMITDVSPRNAGVQEALREAYQTVTQLETQLEPIAWHPGSMLDHQSAAELASSVRNALARVQASVMSRPASPPKSKAADAVHPGLWISKAERLVGSQLEKPKVTQVRDPRNGSYILVTGTAQGHPVRVEFAQSGMLASYRVVRPLGKARVDLADAASIASRWLSRVGLPPMVRTYANQVDGIARFTYQPVVQGVPALDASCKVVVALDQGQVVGFYDRGKWPPKTLPKAAHPLSEDDLRSRLGPQFHVQDERVVLAEDPNGRWVQAVAFDGTFGATDEPYRVVLDRCTGHELSIERLT
ncbi:PepSY1/2 domain-containing protein [Alicyclobacillus vulcanalis]|uniref:Spore germination protein n=1 Tax=Alicyclobacillus vulcanalis TaxID=252246 RepID=A0A1N7NCA0_9BACL|nr:PepSY1/2 domain-containing protein [Alicyclobacillus vulcanalis]SIS95861.1 spore germination protein [Alicyclobacillus vulcanalis]